MPGTARDLGVDSSDPFANLEGGARYLREQLDRFDGDLEKALAAYNAGPGRVIRANGIPRIRETQVYVAAIMGRLSDHSRSSE
jgi:soluble lytic murein transglycosylase-like protein